MKVPAHYDEETGKYVIDVPFPCKFDVENRKWLTDQPDTWDAVIERFKKRGPQNDEHVNMIQKGRHELERLRAEEVS